MQGNPPVPHPSGPQCRLPGHCQSHRIGSLSGRTKACHAKGLNLVPQILEGVPGKGNGRGRGSNTEQADQK